MSSEFYSLQREILELHCEALALRDRQPEALAQLEELRQLYNSASSPSVSPVSAAPPAPTEKHWKYLGEDGLLSPELSLKAARDPELFAEICEEVQAAADGAKRQD